jgi:GTP cyclohydrolase IA
MALASLSKTDTKNLPDLVRRMILALGEDPEREGLQRTPVRVAKALGELTSGYAVDVDRLINQALYTENYSEMVVVKDISFYSLCEHHLLPFFGVCHVAYIPNGRVIGLSKIPKLVKAFSRRLQLQERLTSQIAEILDEKIKPMGVAVVIEGRHLCMEMRGAESANSPSVTSAMLGSFRRDARTRDEFLALIRKR